MGSTWSSGRLVQSCFSWIRCDQSFKKVVEGMEVVKKMESFGSQSGKTSKKIVIADCGQC